MLGQFSVVLSHTRELFLGILKGQLLGSQVMAANVNKFLGVADSCQSSAVFVIKLFKFVRLAASFLSLLLVVIFKVADFTVHLSALNLNGFDFTCEVSLVSTLVGALVTLGDCIFSQATSFEVLFVQQTLRSCTLIIKAEIQFSPKIYTLELEIQNYPSFHSHRAF